MTNDPAVIELQEEFCGFLETLKDVAPVLHSSPRALIVEKNLDMAWYGSPNYAYLMYSPVDLVPGNDFDWNTQPHIKVNFEFEGPYFTTTVWCKYDKDKFVPLTRFIEDNGLTLIIPEELEEHEEEDPNAGHAKMLKGFTGTERIKKDNFFIDGGFLYDLERAKLLAHEIDNQLHSYLFEEV